GEAPWHVADTVWGNGFAWNTLGDDGKYSPRRAQVTTKAVFALWALWETPYTDALMRVAQRMFDDKRGWYEGRVEATGDYNRMVTLSTTATVLEALFYKAHGGPLLRGGLIENDSYFSLRAQDTFTSPGLCLPGERRTEARK
ncbi:DUF3131 domain-containing protein, partial [Cronobacter sakazakii]|uniref:DUF3131 domain-containing protein n=1 Tax=Cronobacter sakazakii TaxID=28141 RepID=UPI002893CC05